MRAGCSAAFASRRISDERLALASRPRRAGRPRGIPRCRAGRLHSKPRAIPAKFLYDARGSALFDAICELPEYYLTRTETEILRSCAAEIAALAGPGCALVEFGSGSSVKSRLLLEAMPDLAAYVPIDISRQHLDATAARLRRDYPRLRVEPVCADYMALARLPPM